jgi:deoxyribonuclease-1
MKCALVRLIGTILFLSLLSGARGDYLDTIPLFWKTLYPDGGKGLYCGTKFKRFDRRYNIEHVFPMSWVAKALGCGDRHHCRKVSERFNRIESDMHNMYPARQDLNRRRGAMAYGIVAGEHWVEPGCDLEIDQRARRVEPRPEVRGNIARAMLYMADRYGLTLYRRQRELLQRWERSDLPDAEEKVRNRRVRKIQGWGNPRIEK